MLPIITQHLAEQKDAALPMADLCALFGLARATLYRRQTETAASADDMKLRDAMQRIALQWSSYGYRRITAELARQGFAVNHKRVLRLRDRVKSCGNSFRASLLSFVSSHAATTA